MDAMLLHIQGQRSVFQWETKTKEEAREELIRSSGTQYIIMPKATIE